MRRFVVGKSKPQKNKKSSSTSDASKDTNESLSDGPVSPPTTCSSPESYVTSSLSCHDVTEDLPRSSDVSSPCKEQSAQETPENSNDRNGFQVHIRIKPLEDQDSGSSAVNRLRCVSVKGGNSVVLCTRPSLKGKENSGNKHQFKFDHVLSESSTQKDTYDVTTLPLVEMTLQGYHSCLITYGSPGTGKSHALFGKASSGKYKGLIIRAADAMMATVDKKEGGGQKAEVSMSFIQIYNEKFYDILDPSATDNIKIHDVGDVHSLDGVTEWPIVTSEDVTKQLRRNPNRLRDAARSHTIFTLYYRKEEELEPELESTAKKFRTIEGRLDFVDLAGVNRATKHSTHDSTGNNATAKANKSLQVFSNVIWALTDPETPAPPYKDSRLTRILREALGGNCATRLLVTASSCPSLAHESLSCLMFAKRAMDVKNFPAPYVSIEEIKQPSPEDIPADEKVALENIEETRSLVSESPVSSLESPSITSSSTSHEKSIVMSAIASPTIKEKSSLTGTLPPINIKTSILSNPLFNQSLESIGSNLSEGNAFSSGNLEEDKSLKKRKSSRDCLDLESGDGKKKSDKLKKSRKKSKSKIPDSPSGSTTPYWQISSPNGQELVSAGQVVTLPQIGTPDQTRHDLPQREISSRDGNGRKKGSTRKQSPLTDVVMATESGVTCGSRERPVYSRSPTPSKDDARSQYESESTLYKSGLKDLNDRKEAFAVSLMTSPSTTSEITWSHLQSSSLDSTSTHPSLTSPSLSDSNCCSKCKKREEKIKTDYDRMILFSKKDRDAKQSRIEELEILLLKAHSESAPRVELQKLADEKAKDKQTLKKQKEMIEMYKSQIAGMVSASEFSNLQELRRKEKILMEKQKEQLETLKKDLDEQTKGASKMLSKKSEQNTELTNEADELKKKLKKMEEDSRASLDQLQENLTKLNLEKTKTASKHQNSLKELNVKLTCALAQVSQLQETGAEALKTHEQEKENLKRELSILTKQVTELNIKSKGKNDTKLKILKCDTSSNTEDIKSRLNGLAHSVQCLRCAAQFALDEDDDPTSLRDAELRILLLQDTKNRELLLQLKRERNLLRDVMKIMYCRQWFTEEGNPHVKRTLRRVGIDTRELVVDRK